MLLGVFIVSALYTKIEVGSLILGYYFIIFGLLSLLEPLISILTRNIKLENYILEFLSYDNKEEKKEIKTKKMPHNQRISSIKKNAKNNKKTNKN